MRIAVVLLLAAAATVQIRAASVPAASPSQADVLAAINSAVAGDTVLIPSGDATWTGSITVTKPIHLQGAGVGQTIIRRTGTSILSWGGNVTASVDGIEFHLTHTNNSADILFLRGRNNKISNCRFVGTTSKVVGVRAAGGTGVRHPTGVVYSCSYFSARSIVQGDIASSPTQAFGRRIWADSDDVVAFGMANTMFFEDCTFDLTTSTGNVIDAEYGGHYVFRHNTVIRGGAFNHGITTNIERGTRLVEIYNNTFTFTGSGTPQDPAVRLRGGTAVVHGNTINGTWPNGAMMLDGELQRFGMDIGDGNLPVTDGTGTHSGGSNSASLADGTKSWTNNAFVGWTVINVTDGSRGTITANTANSVTATLSGGSENDWDAGDAHIITNGYPLRDQIGRGKDATFWTWNGPGATQALEPVYEWNNTFNGGDADFTIPAPYPTWIQAGRDYFADTVMPGYTAFPYPHPLRTGSAVPPFNARVNITTN